MTLLSTSLVSVLFLYSVSLVCGAIDDSKLNINVYYESLCPDSRNFISDQLQPNFHKYADYVNVNLIPYGKSKRQANGDLHCHHGKEECVRNAIHACAIDALKEKSASGQQIVDFVACGMVNRRIDQQKECANEAGILWNEVEACSKSAKGERLIRAAEKETKANTPGPTFVPTIVYNNKYTAENQDTSFFDSPERVVCQYIADKIPQFCSSL